MNNKEADKRTFAQDSKMTPGILGIIAKISKNNSIIPYRQRKETSQKYYNALKAILKPQQDK